MFKAQVLRRSFSLFNRAPNTQVAHSAARNGYENVTIQRFRFKKPFFSRSRKIGILAYAFATYFSLVCVSAYIRTQQAKEGIQVHKNSPPNDKKQVNNQKHDEAGISGLIKDTAQKEAGNSQADVILFIPTSLSRERPKRYYRGTDPEWQAFRKLTRDKERMMKIRQDLVNTIRSLMVKSKPTVARLGRIDEKRTNAWIEFRFPDGPPVEYERDGIALTDDLKLHKVTRRVPNRHHELLERAFSPTVAAGLLYEDAKTRAKASWKHFKVYMEWEEKSSAQTVQQVMQKIGSIQPPSNRAADKSTGTASNPSSSSSPGNNTQRSATSLSAASTALDAQIPKSSDLTLDLGQFRDKYRRKAGHYELLAPPGSFTVVALIQVTGERAKLTMNIEAVYDLQNERYAGMRIDIWNFTDLRQRPKGGP